MPDTTRRLQLVHSDLSDGEIKEHLSMSEAAQSLLHVISDGVIVCEGDFAYLSHDYGEVEWCHDSLIAATDELKGFFPHQIQTMLILDRLAVGWMDPERPDGFKKALLKFIDDVSEGYKDSLLVGEKVLKLVEG